MSSYIDQRHVVPNRWTGKLLSFVIVDWFAITKERLAWSYGPDRAAQIIAGNDPATQGDVARWNSLGRKDAA